MIVRVKLTGSIQIELKMIELNVSGNSVPQM